MHCTVEIILVMLNRLKVTKPCHSWRDQSIDLSVTPQAEGAFAVAMLVFCFEGLDLTEKLNDQLINRCVCFESQYYSWLNILIGYSSAFSHTSWQ